MLHYHPELVHVELIPSDQPANFPPYDLYPHCTHCVPPSGVLSSAQEVSAEKGALIAAQITESIDNAVIHEFA